MISRRLTFLFALSSILSTGIQTAETSAVYAKAPQKAKAASPAKKQRRAGRSYFVPPPPPYTPSLAPRVYYGQAGANQTGNAEAPKAPTYKYKDYVYNSNGNESPKPTQPNPYVTYWGS